MEKKKLGIIEKVMSFVYQSIDYFDASIKSKNKNSETEKSVNPVLSEPPAVVFKKNAKAKTSLRKSSKKISKPLTKVTTTKKMISVRSGKKISSLLAEQMLAELRNKKMGVVSESAEINGKKSLAWVVWALDVADKAKLQEGISIHDVSSLLYHAAQIEIYPINVSRMVHDNSQYIRQVSQDKKTKRYLLTEEGKKRVATLSLAKLVA
jgi:hypothetical protein